MRSYKNIDACWSSRGKWFSISTFADQRAKKTKNNSLGVTHLVERPHITGLLLVAVALLSSSCGVLEELTSFSVCPADLSYVSDMINIPDTIGSLPSVPCASTSGTSTCEASTVSRACQGPFTCDAMCDAETNQCRLDAVFRETQEIDLSERVQSKLQKFVLDRVSVSTLKYSIRENGLNVDIPQVDVYVGPRTMSSETDDGVARLFSIPRIASGDSLESVSVESLVEGREVLENLSRDFQTPFKIMAVIPYSTKANEALPTGSAQIAIQPCLLFKLLE